MGLKSRKINYYTITIKNENGSEGRLLSIFSDAGINYLAFNADITDSHTIRFTIYPNENDQFVNIANKNNLKLDGPHSALHIEGNDESGACADIFQKLSESEITVDFSFGIADIKNGYGIVIHADDKNCDKALAALNQIKY